jgi:hypothetical protein
MYSKHWSTFSLLSFAAVAALSAFYAGRLSIPSAPASLGKSSETAAKPNPSLILSKPAEAADVVTPRRTEDPATRWAELSARPATPAGESEQADWIEKLARQDPQRAIALAAGQNNFRLRAALLRAALKGWGTTNPEAAVAWAQTETVMDQAQAVNALLQGAVQDPDQAASVTAALIKNDSSRAAEYGGDLISALTEAGQFERAANFAAGGAANCREDWMLPAYSRWAEFQPQAAVASAMQITDPGLREAALNAITVGWSPTDPKGMVDFAQNNLPAGQQDFALSSAIGFWADSDPAAAATWINQNTSGPQTDTGVSEIALSPQLAQNPEVAITWAESILNPQLRLETLTTLIEKWTAVDRASAENYIRNSPVLTPEDRTQLLDQSQMLAELKH